MRISPRRSLKEQFKESLKGIQTVFGREIPDPTPMAPPVGFKAAPSLADQIREMVRSERLAAEVRQQGFETFEEADDFDVGDDFDPSTPYEERFDPDGLSSFAPLAEVNKREAEANEKARAKRASSPPQPDPATRPDLAQDPAKPDPAKEPAKPAGDPQQK